jgi:hypothetical protein
MVKVVIKMGDKNPKKVPKKKTNDKPSKQASTATSSTKKK